MRVDDLAGEIYWLHDVRADTALVSSRPMRDASGEWVYLYIVRGVNYAWEPSTPSIFHEPVKDYTDRKTIKDNLISRLEETIDQVTIVQAELMHQIANIHFPIDETEAYVHPS